MPEPISHPGAAHRTLNDVQIRSTLLTAAAVAALLPCAAACAQAGTLPAPAPPASPVSPQGTAPESTAALPQAPSALLSVGGGGADRPAGSTLRYIAGGTMAGPGGYAVEKASDGPLRLSLDDAIALGLKRNLRIQYVRANQRVLRGYTGQITEQLIPNLEFRAAASAQEIDLVALGFKPGNFGSLLSGFGLTAANFPSIVKVNTTSAQLNLNQVLFNVPDYELYRALKPETRSVALTISDSNEQLVQAVAMAYLQVLADEANLDNTIAQEGAAKALYDQALAQEQAGIGIKLDTLRAQVAYQQRQQQHTSAEAQVDKDGIQLNRIMGIPAGQELDLTDDTPFAELTGLDLAQAQGTAYAHRSDLLSLQASAEVAAREVRAIKYQRLPTLALNGYYGVLGVDGGLFHGVFTAQGSLQFPIFNEASQRGEEQTVSAQLRTLQQQEANLRGAIDGQIRTSLLDVNTADQLVKVAQSNVTLAQQALSDSRARFSAGVSDNLEVVDALATVTGAQSQLVGALFQYNVAKVGLARNTGVLEARYRAFLGL